MHCIFRGCSHKSKWTLLTSFLFNTTNRVNFLFLFLAKILFSVYWNEKAVIFSWILFKSGTNPTFLRIRTLNAPVVMRNISVFSSQIPRMSGNLSINYTFSKYISSMTNECNNGSCDQWPNLLKWKINIGETICKMCGPSSKGL